MGPGRRVRAALALAAAVAALAATHPAAAARDVAFRSEGIGLRGELVLPPGPGPHPAIVVLPGPGAPPAAVQRRTVGEPYARARIASLVWTRRAGDAGYGELAADARAALRFLRRRPEIDRARISLWALGDGGYVAPLAAADDPAIASVVLVGASALPPARRRDWAVRDALARDGARGQALALVRDAHGLFAALGRSPVADALGLTAVRDFGRFDPRPAWRRVRRPVLAVWGRGDRWAPVRESAAALAAVLPRPPRVRVLAADLHDLAPGARRALVAATGRFLRAPRAAAAAPARAALPRRREAVRSRSLARVPWYGRTPAQLALTLLALVAVGVLAVVGARRRLEPGGRRAIALAAVDGLLLVGIPATIASILAADGRGVAMVAGLPFGVFLLDLLALAAAGLTAALAVAAVRGGGAPARVSALAGAAFLLYPAFWLL